MRAEASRDRIGAAAKRSDANEDDNSAGLVLSGKTIVCFAAMTVSSFSTSKS